MSCDLAASEESTVCVKPDEQGICITRGTDNVFEVVITDGEGQVIDITLDTIALTLRDKLGGTVQAQYLNLPGSHKDPINGVTEFTIPKAATATASTYHWTYWVYEVRRIQGITDNEYVHIQGDFVILPSVGGP